MRPAEPGHGCRGDLVPDEAFYTHRAVIANDPLADALALPASRGVVVLLGDSGQPVLIAATGDCRALTRRKLVPAERGIRAGADLRSIVREVRAVQCGSAIEADLVYLLLARRLMPHAAKLVADRWRSWWAQIDPRADFPEWSKTDLAVGAVAPRSASTNKGMVRDAADASECIVGPFADKDAAGRFIERMIDAFDLCREHRLLVLAPRAQACAYKEMGRCAAPCDGSETMDSYRKRVADALHAAATGDGMLAAVQREEAAMQTAAAAQDFESAARHRSQSQRLRKLAGPTASRVCTLRDFSHLIVWRSPRDGWVRLACCDRGFVRWLADVQVSTRQTRPGEDLVQLCRDAAVWTRHSSSRSMSRDEVDALGLLARERVAPDTKRAAWFVPLHPGQPPAEAAKAVMRAAAAALKPRKVRSAPADGPIGGSRTRGEADGDDAPVHEIEAMPGIESDHSSEQGAQA